MVTLGLKITPAEVKASKIAIHWKAYNATKTSDIQSFTSEEEILFNTRYNEGYNLYDPRYIAWIKVNHPEENCASFMKIIDYFPEATTPEALPVSLESEDGTPCSCLTNSASVEKAQDHSSDYTAVLTPSCTESTFVPNRLNFQSPDSTPTGSSSINSISPPCSSNMISKYLIQYVPVAEKKKERSTRVTGLRVLTSEEGLAILQEREDKKKREKEEKEKRKEERLNKRKQKEEMAKEKQIRKQINQKAKERTNHKDQNVSKIIMVHLYIAQKNLQRLKTQPNQTGKLLLYHLLLMF